MANDPLSVNTVPTSAKLKSQKHRRAALGLAPPLSLHTSFSTSTRVRNRTCICSAPRSLHRRLEVNMEPDAKRPMVIAAVAILVVVVVVLRGFAPLVRFQIITLLISRRQRARGAAPINDPSTVPGPFRRNRLVVAIFGAPAPLNVDVEQARAAASPPFADPSLALPPPAYTDHRRYDLYDGTVVYSRPYTYAAAAHNVSTGPAQHPPPYASSPSLGPAPSAPTAS